MQANTMSKTHTLVHESSLQESGRESRQEGGQKSGAKAMAQPCILCLSSNTLVVDRVKKADLCALYARGFGVDVGSIVKTDLLYYHCGDCDLRFFACEDGSIPTGDNDFYNALNKLEWYYFSQKHEYQYAARWIEPESKVLEVGCGKGAFAKFLPEVARKNYVGLEFSTEAKKMAAKDGILIENISIEEYAKSHAQSFDISCSFQVLEHVSDPHSFLQAQIACLKGKDATPATGGGGEAPRFRQMPVS